MASTTQRTPATGSNGFFIIASVLYLAFLGLFLWQTAQFVNWLFPSDQVIYKVITVTTFDVMAILWACIDTFYRFATKGSHNLVKWAWGISFIASLVASVFYMVLQSMTRLNFIPSEAWIDVGYTIVILVTVLQILFLTFFIRQEWMIRHPKTNDYEYDRIAVEPIIHYQQQPETRIYPYPAQQPAQIPERVTNNDELLKAVQALIESTNKANNPGPVRREPKPFLATPGHDQQQVPVRGQKKQLPPLQRGGWIVNPFRKGEKQGSQAGSTQMK